ncbi:hypothetical protein V6C03_00470 [Methyloligella sp. 2.7D]|uniref:hypothetical protein n=1 Tax=unclassified Methyloligella TaxID=2625955 RepID=UPI00157C0850|nr:hypothetical protein [Methyloligella sp. GL2]QKP76854.1 hypothetical protein HT051_04945 [Methyloligella sp. GL2]
MSIELIPQPIRVADLFSHIDMGFLNRRLAITALGPLRDHFFERQRPGEDHMTVLSNDHLLVTMLIDRCTNAGVPTLTEALRIDAPQHMFMSIERLEPCPEIYEAARVSHTVHFDLGQSKPVKITYHTSHLVSETGRMTLADGYEDGHRQAIIGLLRDKGDAFEVEPIVIGAPWLEHPRNADHSDLMWYSHDYGEVLPEDIAEFALMKNVEIANAEEWMSAMENISEDHVKASIAHLLNEPTKPDWGGEENDHFSANVTLAEKRTTAAFLLKGPSKFQEMTPAMCGKNGDQIYRLAKSGANISVVQHAHLIGSAVRETLRSMIATSGRSRKFCVMDGQATYKLLKAYGLLPSGAQT